MWRVSFARVPRTSCSQHEHLRCSCGFIFPHFLFPPNTHSPPAPFQKRGTTRAERRGRSSSAEPPFGACRSDHLSVLRPTRAFLQHQIEAERQRDRIGSKGEGKLSGPPSRLASPERINMNHRPVSAQYQRLNAPPKGGGEDGGGTGAPEDKETGAGGQEGGDPGAASADAAAELSTMVKKFRESLVRRRMANEQKSYM